MDILDKAIAIETGVNRLADALGVRQNVISNWKKRGIPRPWLLVLQLLYGKHTDPDPDNAQVLPLAKEVDRE